MRRIYRERDDWTGAVYLFFGVRTEAECLYRDEFDSYLDRPGYHRTYTFSREQKTADGRRMYVQHRMAERIGELRELLDRDQTVLYICGLKGMEDGIEAIFEGGPIRRCVRDVVPRPACGGTNPGRDLLNRPIPTRLCVACPCGGRAKLFRPMLCRVGGR